MLYSLQPVHNTETTWGNLLFSTSWRLTSHLKNFFSLAPHFLNEASILLLLLLLSNIIEASGLSHVASCLKVFILEKASSIRYGYRKCWTHARVFSRTLAHGDSKIEIRQLKKKWKKARRKEWIWNEAQWARKSPVNLNVKIHLILSSHVRLK